MKKNSVKDSIRPLAVITGASSGIGYELAQVFAQNGFDLVIAAEDSGIYDAANTFQALGVHVDAVKTDLASADGVDLLFSKLLNQKGRLDSVVLNAGVGLGGPFAETDIEDELRIINLNIVSLLRLTKKVLPEFLSQGHGRFLFTSSVAAEVPGPYFSVYAASKAFVQSFAEALRYEVKEKGIIVTSLQPGPTDTQFFERADMMDTKAATGKKDDPADVAKDGFNALMAGKDHVVAGSIKNKLQASLSKFIPETAGAAMQARETKPGSAKH